MRDRSGAATALRFLVSRVLVVIGIGLLVSMATFFTLRLARDPVATIGAQQGVNLLQPGARAKLAHELGTDRSLVAQYGSWLGHAVRGDLGRSDAPPYHSVGSMILQALPVNLELMVLAQLIALVIAVPLGLWSGSRAGTRVDRVITTAATGCMSYPAFALALVLITVLSVQLRLFPVTATGYVGFFDDPLTNLHVMFLPALSLAIGMIGVYTRVLRSDVATTLQEDFVLTARSRGLSPRSILLRHALRPSSLSLVSLVGLQSGFLLGGSLLVERLFAFPYGIGSTLVPAAVTVDIPVVLSTATVIGVVFTTVMILFDMLLRLVDPRIRRG